MKPSYYALIALVLSLSTSSRAERQPTLIFDAEERKFSWYDGGGKRHKAIDNGVYNTVIFEAHQSIDVRIHNARFGSLYRVQVLDNPVEEIGAIRGLEEAVPLLRLAFPTDLVLPEIKGGLHLRPGLSDSLRAMLERLDSLQDVEDLKLEIAREADRLTKDIDALAARIDAYRRKTERLSGLDGRASTNPLGELRAAMDALRAEISAELRPAESMYENEKAFVEFVQRSNRLIREVNSVEQHIKTATTAFTGSIQTQSDKLRLDLADMRARLIAYRLKVDRMQATVPLVEGLLEYRTGLKVEADLIERGIEHLRDSLDIETIEVLKASLDVKAAEAALKAEIEKSKLEKAPKNEAEIDAARKVLGQAKAKLAPSLNYS